MVGLQKICPKCKGVVHRVCLNSPYSAVLFRCEDCKTLSAIIEEELFPISQEDEWFWMNSHKMTMKLVIDENESHKKYRRLTHSELEKIIPIEKCAKCGFSGPKESLDVHHKNGVFFDNRPENLIVLCSNCHRTVDKRWYLSDIGEAIPKYKGKLPKKPRRRTVQEIESSLKRVNRRLDDSIFAVIEMI